MNAKRWLLVIGAAAVSAAATGCKDQKVRDYLGPSGPMVPYLKFLADAVCELEDKNPAGLPTTKRVCPNGPGGPGDKTPPPVYPR
jgi:hypothetical protein